jgi:hypothetical protein
VTIDRTTDLGERRVFEGPEADATLVRVALEREGIRTAVHSTHAVRSRLSGAVYVVDAAQIEQARVVVARFVKGSTPSEAAVSATWQCRSCGEAVEGQFEACWRCGAARPS